MSRLKKPNMKLEFYLCIYIYTYLFRYKSWNVYCSYTEFIHQTTALQVDLRYMCLQLLYVVGVHSCWSLAPVCVCVSKWEFATSVAHHLTGYVHDGSPVLKQQTWCYLHWCCISIMTWLQKAFWPVLLQVLGDFLRPYFWLLSHLTGSLHVEKSAGALAAAGALAFKTPRWGTDEDALLGRNSQGSTSCSCHYSTGHMDTPRDYLYLVSLGPHPHVCSSEVFQAFMVGGINHLGCQLTKWEFPGSFPIQLKCADMKRPHPFCLVVSLKRNWQIIIHHSQLSSSIISQNESPFNMPALFIGIGHGSWSWAGATS